MYCLAWLTSEVEAIDEIYSLPFVIIESDVIMDAWDVEASIVWFVIGAISLAVLFWRLPIVTSAFDKVVIAKKSKNKSQVLKQVMLLKSNFWNLIVIIENLRLDPDSETEPSLNLFLMYAISSSSAANFLSNSSMGEKFNYLI